METARSRTKLPSFDMAAATTKLPSGSFVMKKAAPEIRFEFSLEDIITVSVRLYRAGIASAAAPHTSAVIRERAESILSKGVVVWNEGCHRLVSMVQQLKERQDKKIEE